MLRSACLLLRRPFHAITVSVSLAVGVAGATNAAAAALIGEPIQPIPRPAPQDPARVELGRRLFSDGRLSATGAVSCASCHDIRRGGVDQRARSIGVTGKGTELNAPTVLNAALNIRQFWNGRASSLESQIDDVVQSPIEMGSVWGDVVRKVASDPRYRADFEAAYPNGVSRDNIQNAIATYERTLLTPGSRFDRWLLGDATAISAAEKAGYEVFKASGCVACHQGVNAGGNMFQKFGTMGDYFAARGNPTASDVGRYAVTHDPRDRYVFKVPGLRNVALTAPYFHDASARTLEEAVDVMFRYQLGRIASRKDRDAVVLFLGTLTGVVEEAR